MESLLQWIGKNPGVLVILFALAGPLWGYIRQSSRGGAGRGPAPMPSFGGGPGERKPPEAAPSMGSGQQEPEVWAEKALRRYQETAGAGEGITMEGEESPSSRRAPVTSTASTPPRPAGPAQPTPAAAGGVPAPAGEEMVRAVVWAEILGPPRAKKPYGRP
ncbi:hypothetical protein [Gorillibacterium sp. sgz5001074]|uniref:hypothetical protein n=1 Tax=Gorillibacterium sp. sgz5001074 TaxID=3446695 RepID=UPI003F66A5BA